VNQILAVAIKHRPYVTPIVAYPRNKKEFNRLVSYLDELLLIVGNNENHCLIGLVDILSILVKNYEAKHYPILKILELGDKQIKKGRVKLASDVIKSIRKNKTSFHETSGVEVLKFLMQSHNLHQSDLKDIGSQSVVSEILSGKRKLTLRQINKLAKRFNVAIETFIDT
jgi:HTH-type transcriptional regulator/antitoxin HigA